ncbi:hypothetical protein [uncultured Bifidobacterium sp.]|uniref:hypothetical protein n=1 Tax=uncultured Bifidobacterium sp. TaxID=165187 RepID=UPI002613F77F|nr:hypothetical protein [uncultured Bifidobacterium sp.]
MSPMVYRAVLRLTAPDEYRRLYGRGGKPIGNNRTTRKDGRHGTDIRTAQAA